jgi:putative two-component system response regulator
MKKLLVVDDNISILKQINGLLEDRYEFFLAKSGALALKMCGQIKPDCILLDIEMPEMNGFETIAKLKEDPGLRSIPVIFLTGNHDEATKKQAIELGAEDVLTKPVDKYCLIDRIEFCLGHTGAESGE